LKNYLAPFLSGANKGNTIIASNAATSNTINMTKDLNF
jgi:hypothetical protein